jgi:predicted O-methyltransferase YrrM
VRSRIRRAAESVPNLVTALSVYRTLRRQRRAFAAAGRDERPVEELLTQTADGLFLEIQGHDLVDLRLGPESVVASQKYDELIPFLSKARELNPRSICEIGTSAGGTLYALTRIAAEDAIIVSVDISIPETTRLARFGLSRERQRLVSIEGDSQEAETRALVEKAIGSEPLDVLFIDGDHSYTGVRSDFELYSPLVRKGGIIGLHDINEDFSTRLGVSTAAISGDVPRFWRELKERYETEELIADREQDGYGIGIVYR